MTHTYQLTAAEVSLLSMEVDLSAGAQFEHGEDIAGLGLLTVTDEALAGQIDEISAAPQWRVNLQQKAFLQVKASLIAEVNRAAEAERQRYITPGEGQAMTYTEKLAQARAFLAAVEPNQADYPMVANEVGITATTAAGVAEAIIAAYTAWAAIGAAIEKVRMEANKGIAESTDADAAKAIRNDIMWPTGS